MDTLFAYVGFGIPGDSIIPNSTPIRAPMVKKKDGCTLTWDCPRSFPLSLTHSGQYPLHFSH